MSPGESEFLKNKLEYFKDLRIIKKCESPWAAPILLVKKKNGELHLVVDYRKLNKVTRKDTYLLPHIDELLDCLGKASVFSTLDMCSGFYQIVVDPDSREKIAFVTKYGTYQYNRLPMDLCNSLATFQRLVDIIFSGLICDCMVAYVDDLNIYSNVNNDHF